MTSQFAPPSLTVGEAQDLSPRIVRAESLVPLKDTSAETVSRNQAVYRPDERPQDPSLIQAAEPAVAESVNSSKAKFDSGEDEMGTKRAMTINRFVPGPHPAVQ